LVDKNDPTRKTVWAGAVAGGLWKTTDITQTAPNWTPFNDFFQNLAITHIDQAPNNGQIMYFCTGEGNNNLDAVRGLGVRKSSNGGNTWNQLSSTNNADFHFCQKISLLVHDVEWHPEALDVLSFAWFIIDHGLKIGIVC
jgi:hypothetical protein